MDNLGKLIAIFSIIVLLSVRWWYITKDNTTKKFILLEGIFFLLTVVFWIIGNIYNVTFLALATPFVFLGAIFFLIKALISERKFHKNSPHS